MPSWKLSAVFAADKEELPVRLANERGPVCQTVHLRQQVQADKRLPQAPLQQEVLRRRLSALRADVRQDAQLQEPQVRVSVSPGTLLSLHKARCRRLQLSSNKGKEILGYTYQRDFGFLNFGMLLRM